jgi:DNA-binding response OmpR family regulator
MAEQKSVLVADDSHNDFLVFQLACRKAGWPHKLFRVHDGEEALAYLKGDPPFADRELWPFPDIVVLDAKMPKMNGFELLMSLRERADILVPIVMLSGSIVSEDKSRALRLGAADYLTKPAETSEMVALVQSLEQRWLR